MGKVNIGIVMGHILDSGFTVDMLENHKIPINEMLETGRISKHDISMLACRIGKETSLLMKQDQQRGEGINHQFNIEIFTKRVTALGWTTICLNSVCTHAENVIRDIRDGKCDTLFNYELVNLCYLLECDPLYLRGKRKNPTVTTDIYITPSPVKPPKVFVKLDSSKLIQLIVKNVGLKKLGIDDDPKNISIKSFNKIALILHKRVGCGQRYAYDLLTKNPSVSKFVIDRLANFTHVSIDDLIQSNQEKELPEELPVEIEPEEVDTSSNEQEVDVSNDITEEIKQAVVAQPIVERIVKSTKEEDMTTSVRNSSFVNKLFEVLDLMTECPEYAKITNQLLNMSDDERKKSLAFIQSAFDLLSK